MHADEIALVAERHRLADVGIEFELVLDVFRREQGSILEPADVLGAIDDFQVAVFGSKKPASPERTQPSGVLVSAVLSGSL